MTKLPLRHFPLQTLTCAAFAAAALLCAAGSARAGTQAFPAAVKQAITNHAPVVYVTKDEAFLPSRAEVFVAASERTSDGGLRLKDPARPPAGDLATAPAYVNVQVGDQSSVIQYWFFYNYNGPGTADLYNSLSHTELVTGPCGRHEGDWEAIFVQVSNTTGAIEKVYLNQHSGGVLVPHALLGGLTEDGRIRVFSSHNGHASYAAPGPNPSNDKNFGVARFATLNKAAHHQRWDTRGHLQVINAIDFRPYPNGNPPATDAAASAFFQAVRPSFMSITGKWGRVVKHSRDEVKRDLAASWGKESSKLLHTVGVDAAAAFFLKEMATAECFEESGPTPPWSKNAWTGWMPAK